MKHRFFKLGERGIVRKGAALVAALLVVLSLGLAGCGSASNKPGAGAETTKLTEQQEQARSAQEHEKKMSDARNTPIVKAARAVGPAVVGITNKAYVRDFFNRVQLAERGTGSGVIYDKSGLIVTNNHVVEGASEIVVSLSDGTTMPGKILGTDPATDLAVVKIDAKRELPVAQFGDSSDIMVGEPAIAIGNPLGLEFRGSVTVGVISALNRSVQVGERKFTLIQTDAAINPGNSGGALVNADGKVIGINSAKIAVSNVEGIGFAIPINAVKPIVKELAETGKVAHPYVGASLIDKTIAAHYGFDADLHDGLMIMKLVRRGPLDLAGARTGDIITAFTGKKTETVADLRDAMNQHKAGDTVTVTVLRNGRSLDLSVTLQEYPG